MKLRAVGKIWWNGELVPWEQANVHVATHALHYASSVFEGMRAYATPRGPAVVHLRRHAERLMHSCRIVGIPLPIGLEELEKAIVDTVRVNGYESSYIRPVVFRGYGQLGVDPSACPVQVAVIVIELGTYFAAEKLEKGVNLGVSSYRRPAPDTLPVMAKSAANYLNSQLVLLEAKSNGFDDGLALDIEGFLSEGSGANVFLVQRGALHTPSVDSSILEGITRACVIQIADDLGIEVVRRRIPRESLYISDEIFLCGSAAEVTPVNSVDHKQVGKGGRGPLTERIQREYSDIVHGRKEDRHEWLTLVGS